MVVLLSSSICIIDCPQMGCVVGHVDSLNYGWCYFPTSFFPIVDTCLNCEDNSQTELYDGAKMAIFCILYF